MLAQRYKNVDVMSRIKNKKKFVLKASGKDTKYDLEVQALLLKYIS